jgi:quinoprotein glucose dehydrogenase
LPGYDGGGEWGGAAFDPELATLFVNASEMPWVLTMIDVMDGTPHTGRIAYATHCLYCHGVDREGDPLGVYPALTQLDDEDYVRDVMRHGRGAMPSVSHLEPEVVDSLIAYLFDRADPHLDSASPAPLASMSMMSMMSTGYHRFVDDNGDPAIEPPWGTLTAIDLEQGEIRWQVPLGGVNGTENYGGPVVTAGGLVFIAATKDEKFHAFDKKTGELLWEVDLPAGGYATPATYAVDGRQFVVIAAGGGKMGTPSGDAYLAFALAKRP